MFGRPIAVFDVETTGFSPQYHDRIIEIAIVRLGPEGEPEEEFETLINPLRDVGATHIHGITARDVQGAPTFAQIAGSIACCLSGAVLVAHNAPFDLRFLRAEFSALGYEVPEVPSLCTMQAASRLLGCGRRKLQDLCLQESIPLDGAHAALNDARATALLLRHLMASYPRESWLNCGGFSHLFSIATDLAWPALPRQRPAFTRRHAAAMQSRERPVILDLIESLPSDELQPSCEEYRQLLIRVLEDRVITQREIADLIAAAAGWGLSLETVLHAHRDYLAEMARSVARAGRAVAAEQRDLHTVQRLLGISDEELAVIFSELEACPATTNSQPAREVADQPQIENRTICFTGAFRCTRRGIPFDRNYAEELATARGLIVRSSVSRSLDYLVCCDPLSQSGKARKAREYGVRMLAEIVFWHMMEVEVD